MSERPFDLVVLGATGVTGRQAARYLAQRASELGLSWAVAGRDRDALETLSVELAGTPDVLVADTESPTTLDALAGRTRAIANLVGPYARHGQAVYSACIRNGAHQVDASGEMDWLRQQIRDHAKAAEAADVAIVHTAGFEALPFDIGTAAIADRLADERDSLQHVDVAIEVTRDPPILAPVDLVSGGTLTSGTDAIRRGSTSSTRDARHLIPDPHEPLPFVLAPRRHPGTGTWLGPMVPSPHINPAVVHRSAHLLGRRCGFAPSFRFDEGLASADLFPGLPAPISAGLVAAAQAWTAIVTAAPAPFRELAADTIEAFGPTPGMGPSDEHLDGWRWKLDFHAVSSAGSVATLGATGLGHPGYRSSANFVVETAIALATRTSGPVGILTPAAALGASIAGQLEPAGLRFGAIDLVPAATQ